MGSPQAPSADGSLLKCLREGGCYSEVHVFDKTGIQFRPDI